MVLEPSEEEPKNMEILGEVKIGDTGFSTNCGYEKAIDEAKAEARKIGGNAIRIIKHKLPSVMGSTCHRITASILKISDIDAYNKSIKAIDSTLANTYDYATLHFYRNGGYGILINYDLHLGDSVIGKVKNRWRKSIKIKKEGYHTIWAKTETRKELSINVKMGREYYIRCAIGMGLLVGHPSFSLIDSSSGKVEYSNAIRIRDSDTKDLLILNDGRKIECIINSEDDEYIYNNFQQ